MGSDSGDESDDDSIHDSLADGDEEEPLRPTKTRSGGLIE